MNARDPWPSLDYAAWLPTYETLHRWTQIVGKVKLALCPPQNEWWHVPFFLDAHGLTTGNIPAPEMSFEVTFDLVEHRLDLATVSGQRQSIALDAMSVAAFYRRFFGALRELGVAVTIDPTPQEIEDTTPCDVDEKHCSYDPAAVRRYWSVIARTERVLQRFRSGFAGKSSPIQLYWGSFDLSYVRYSGKPFVGERGPNRLMRLSNDEQHWAAGFWPGNAKYPKAAFYGYAAPHPAGYEAARVEPAKARFDHVLLGEFLLDNDDLCASRSPDEDLLAFLRTTYAAAADLGGWDRAFLERSVT